MKLLDKIITYGLYLFVFLLPWQTRWIYQEASLNGGVWEYGRFSLYGTEILLVVLLMLSLVRFKLRIAYRVSRIANFWLWIGLLVIWSALTILWSADKQLAWYGWLRLAEGAGLAWLVANRKSQIANRGIALSLIASGVVQSLLAIWQWVAQWSLANKWLGMAFFDPASGGVSVIENNAGRFLRAYGSLPHPNILAGFLVICLLTAVILLAKESSVKIKPWLYGAIAVLSMGLFLTFSRAGWISLIISLFAYLIICLFKKVSVKKFRSAVLLIIVVFGSLTYFYSDLVKIRLSGSERLEVRSNQERLAAYDQSWPIVKEHWLAGVGLGQYTLVLSEQQPGLESWAYQPVHDVGLLTWAELGIVGLMLYVLIFISAFKKHNPYHLLLIAILLLGFFDHYFRSFYFGIMLWWLVIGLNVKLKEE